ncbi:hypothetical protein DPV78_003073 [Talaromyces pinophilus]|nr:hypothetical protein DPV78_003073 [Talaromyces pinophilus]
MELSCNDPAYRDELSNVVVWDQEKFKNVSIDEIRKDFKRELLILEIGDNKINSNNDYKTSTQKYKLRCQREAELVVELDNDTLAGEITGSFCLLINNDVFQSILNAPEPADRLKWKYGEHYVKIVRFHERSLRNEY